MTQYALGIDLSPNHAGFVCLRCDTFKLIRAVFVTNKLTCIKHADKVDGRVKGVRFPAMPGSGDSDLTDLTRIDWWMTTLKRLRDDVFRKAHFIGVEGYAYGVGSARHSNAITQYAHVGGLVRWLFRRKCLRIHDPLSIKLFGAGGARIDTRVMEEVVWRKLKVDFREWNAGTGGENRPSEDLTVAYVIARMVAMEYQLRVGMLTHSDLEENELRVFNRVTKSNPFNILSRDWLTLRRN